MSKVNSLHHIVISTKNRERTIKLGKQAHPLYAYINGIIKSMNCKLIRIGGIDNHIHLLVDVHQDVALSHLVRDVKRASSIWIHSQSQIYNLWEGWSEGYYAFSVGYDARQSVINYINNQIEHHYNVSYDDEMSHILTAYNMV